MSDAIQLKDTLNLPRTKFPMQAKLVEREGERLARWEADRLYEKIQTKNAHKPCFMLHDGPPFTNGDVHVGTALNKILKDIILRFKSMRGFATPYIPGWDCHGLPIEHKVSQEHPELLQDPVKLRTACEQFSAKFIKIQEGQFKRLGVLADWEHAYKTTHASYEASVLKIFSKFVKAGLVYRSKKPVYWSIPCKTALAEAEIEYKNHTSTTVWVKFLLKNATQLDLPENTYVVIWTTTPWTLPANRAIALSPTLTYVALKTPRASYLVAKDLADSFIKTCRLENVSPGKTFGGKSLEGQLTQHPFLPLKSPIVLADYVTLDAGTGCVHTAPGHGIDDYLTGLKYKLDIACPVDDEGRFMDDGLMPQELIGKAVIDGQGKSPANDGVIEILKTKGALLHQSAYEHAYPHCWRSKTPVIARALPQWFIRLDTLKQRAIEVIDQVTWLPIWGKKRIQGSVQARPDWCISRQRTWGIPLPVFYDAQNQPLLDATVVDHISDKIGRYGSQWWFESDVGTLLKDIPIPQAWMGKSLRKGEDTLDVWIDSGCSHAAVLKQRGLNHPADLYLEGSDQHRGWFQSSLMTSLIDGDCAPYKSVLTHGFFVDENRKKVSKSDGSPQTAEFYTHKYGADILRLWVASEDYRNDIPVSENILQHVISTYRTLRNTIRFQIGNLFDFDYNRHACPIEKLTPIDCWALHETNLLIQEVTKAYEVYEFHRVYQAISCFCSVTLSARYHDILKDRLYTLGADWPERRASQTVLYLICNTLLRLLAPILTFTADEAWGYLQGNEAFGYDQSIHLSDFPATQNAWYAENICNDFNTLFKIREQVQVELEKARQQKIIGQSLDAKAEITFGGQHPWAALLQKYQTQLAEYFIVSAVKIQNIDNDSSVQIRVEHADGVRCPRTWRWVDRLVEVDGFGCVSERCEKVLKNWHSYT
ncbi:MAG: isoleucine--tRNA ligase [Puniceicoccales bacterium]|jgi:isoleucyl-tRNA synthetase|nr:isoleucine--tRNA ligase [Puniceicoccales bacterium]